SDDINGIRSIYSSGAARAQDAFDAVATNNSIATATDITGQINATTYTATITGLDISSTSDVDYFKVSGWAPTSTGSMTVTVQSKGLSFLAPTLTVYAADQTTVVASASGAGQYGAKLSVTISGVGQGQVYYIKVGGADTSAFVTGAYALTLNAGTDLNPIVPVPNTQMANGNPISGGGGIANRVANETMVNTTTVGIQQFTFTGQREVATDANGNFVVIWSSDSQ